MRKEQKRKPEKIILRMIKCLSACVIMLTFSACGGPQTALYSAGQTEDATVGQADDGQADGEPTEQADDGQTADEPTEQTAGTDMTEAAAGTDERVAVHVCGAVLYPGVYYLEPGSIRQEALDAAGGFAEDAAVDYVNLAAQISAGEKLYIPYADEVSGQDIPVSGTDGNVSETAAASGKVNLNTAAKEELMTLPGIGESKADAIIRYREETGLFQNIEDIMLVPGIKEGTYNNIKEYIVVD